LSITHFIWIAPKYIPVHVLNWKIEKYIERSHLACCRDRSPLKVESIRIEDTQASTVVSILNMWKNITQKDLVTVALKKVDFRTVTDKCP